MSNTAEKLEYQEQMDMMTKLNHNAFARTVWDDPEKAVKLHAFWKTFSHGKSPEIQRIAQLEMRRLEAAMIKMTDINCGFYGVQATAYVDTVGESAIVAEDNSIEEILPEKEVVVDAETNLGTKTADKEEGKTVSLFNGKDMGDAPNQVNIANSVKQLLADGKEEDAVALAKQYLGAGKYTPKKPGAKAQPWKDKQIESWIKSLKVNLSKSTPKVEEETKVEPKTEEASTDTADENFGQAKNTLELETHALKDFAERYTRLALNGSEDAIAAEELAKLFFADREYNEKQIQVWKETVTNNDDISQLDHFAILGAVGTEDGQLTILDTTYEELLAKIYDMMQEIQVTKPQLKDNKTLQEYMIDQVSRKLYDELNGTCFNSESGATYNLYTKLHYADLIERMVTVNFTTLDSQATTSEEVGQETGEASSSKEATTESDDFAKEQAEALAKAKKRSLPGTNIKEITLSIIKNGGVVDDIFGNHNYDFFFGKEHKWQAREALEKHVSENFETWATEYKNSLTSYPMDEFQRAVDTAYFSEVEIQKITKEVKEFMVKPDGKVLDLLDKATKDNPTESVVKFPSVKDLEDYILNIYKNNKNAESIKQIEKDVQKDTQEDPVEAGTKSESTEEESSADKTSGEAKESTVQSSSNVVVKITHIENICNKAIKKGKDLSFVMKDRKISELVEKGGTIIGLPKDSKAEYNITSESFDQLTVDLQKIYDNAVAKKNPTTEKKSVLDKVKQVVSNVTKGEESKETKPTEVESKEVVTEEDTTNNDTETSVITSLNDVKPVGLALIEQGGSKDDLLKWGRDNLLNRKMKEQEDNAIFTTTKAVDTFIKGMFSDLFKEETPEVVNEKKTVEDLISFINTASKEENATYISVCKAANDYTNKNSIDIKQGGVLKLVRETAVDLHKAHLAKQNANREESQEKVFVPEKISETAPTVWDKVKDFKTLGEIYTTALELCDAGDWQQALNITTELIKSGNIESTEEWTDNMITQWFNINVLKEETPESTKEVETVKEVEDLDDNFKTLQNANGGKAFRNAIIQILTDNEDTPELRRQIEQTVRGSKANYAKKMAKAKSSVIQGKINAAKVLVKKKA